MKKLLISLLLLCGCAMFGEKGMVFDGIPSGQESTFKQQVRAVKNVTGWSEPEEWSVRGREGTKPGSLCGQPSWAFYEQGKWCIGLTTGNKHHITTILAQSPDGSYNCAALYHEALQGMGYANGKIPDNDDHPKEFLKYIPKEFQCGWR